MPRLGNRVPKYRKHKQSGQAIVTINGRDHLLGPHGTRASKVEYDRLITEWLSSGRSPVFGVSEHILSVVELVVAYLDHAKAYYGGGPRGEYANLIHAFRPLRELYGRLAAREFSPLQLKAVREKYIAAGHSRTHINQNVRRIGRMFRWAVTEGLAPPEVPAALAMVPGLRKGHTTAKEGRKVRPVEDAVVEATLPHLPPVVRSMVELQRVTGMRPGEVCVLRPCDVDRSGDVWAYQPIKHKNTNRERERTVYIGPRGQEILRPYLLRAADVYCFSPRESEAKRRAERQAARKTPSSCGNVPGSNSVRHKPKRQAGVRYSTQSYGHAVRRACDKAFRVPADIADNPAAVEKWRADHRWFPNQLRHTTGTTIRKRFGLEAAQTVLGHSKADVTQVYAERDLRMAANVIKQIG